MESQSMPPQTAKPVKSLMARYGDRLRKAHEATKDAEVKVNAGDLPAGINSGIAQLTKAYFGVYENGDMKGEPYFMASGICVEPKVYNGIPTAGCRVQFGPEPMCDTPNRQSAPRFEDHVAKVENLFKALGADMSNTEADDAMEATAAALQEARPFFRFRTWQSKATPQYPDPKVNCDWGMAVNFSPTDDPNAVQDDTTDNDEPTSDEVQETIEAASPTPAKPATKPVAKGPVAKKPPVKPDLSESTDLDALLAAANDAATDEEYASVASTRLTALAIEVGHDEETVNAAESWDAVVELINNPPTADEEPAADEPSGWKKDDLCEYKPVDPKTKKPDKAVLCEITKVDDANETVDLRSTVNKKQTWAKIPFAKIEVAS